MKNIDPMTKKWDRYRELPQPETLSVRECKDAMSSYLMMFVALAVGLPLPILNLLAALTYYYVNRKRGLFVRFHKLHSLIAQVPTSLLNAGAVGWGFWIFFHGADMTAPFIGYLMVTTLANLLYIIFSIIAAIKARSGRMYFFFFFGKLAYETVFRIRNSDKEADKAVNLPPG